MSSPLVSTAWLDANLERSNLRGLDCSVTMRTAADGTYGFVAGRDEWAAGHIPGSVFVDVLADLTAKDTLLPLMMPAMNVFADKRPVRDALQRADVTIVNALSPEQLFAEVGALGAKRTIVYCGAGIAASSDALALTLLGAEHVAVYDGSLAEWTADPSLPMERG